MRPETAPGVNGDPQSLRIDPGRLTSYLVLVTEGPITAPSVPSSALMVDELAEPVGADVSVALAREQESGDVLGFHILAKRGVEGVGQG